MEEKEGKVVMQKYMFGKLLGQGHFAKVYHATDINLGTSVAIKVINKRILKPEKDQIIHREISAMRLLKHPNVIHIHQVMATKSKIYLVMEYARGGELFEKVANGKLEPDAARKYFQQLIAAVDFCHSRGVYHRDIKPENLLLDENGNLKVSDFGLSALAETKRRDGLLHTICGTPGYAAPEVLIRRGYDGEKNDIWSCGIVLFVLLSGYLPFQDYNIARTYRKMERGEFKCPSWVTPDARTLISKMLDPNPVRRISMSEIMRDSWFSCGLETKAGKEKETSDGDVKVLKLNAFEIISLANGLDLSGLFEERDRKKEVKFVSKQPVKNIVSKFEELARNLKMRVMKGGGLLKLERSKAGRKGLLSIEVDVFEVASDFHVVEMRRSNGDTLEYREMMKEEIRPSLKDIVWSWQGDDPEMVVQ